MTKEEEFLKRLLVTFKIEAEEHVAEISSGLIELEKQLAPDKQQEIIEVIYREAHSLKGAARSVNLATIELVCQAMESVFAVLKRGEMALTTSLFDLLNEATDIVNKLLSTPDPALTPEERTEVQTIKQKLADAAKGELPSSAPGRPEAVVQPAPQPESSSSPTNTSSPHPPFAEEVARKQASEPQHTPLAASAGIETIRIPAAKLDPLLLKAEELVSAKLATRQYAYMAKELKEIHDAWKEQWSQVAADSRASSPEQLLELHQNFSKKLESKLFGLKKTAEEDSRSIGGMVDTLLGDMKNLMMFPVASVFGTFPKLVRDISREQEKDIDLSMLGGDIEIDKRILQEIKDPLIHLVRNCIDHGIETKEARRQKKKPEKGSLKITVSQKDSGKVEIVIADDGAGINVDRIKGSALKQGVITAEQAAALSQEDALALLFESGITTSSIITTVSGRGLGMAIVQEKIEKLGGTISIQTVANQGTTLSLLLPLSHATFRGILIQTGGQVFAIPTMYVERVQQLPWQEVRTVENRETIQLNGTVVSLVRLDQVLELPPQPSAERDVSLCVMVLNTGNKSLAFAIDEMLYEDEILLKSLGNQLSRVRNISGATVLGSGKVIPILNASDLIKSALQISAGSVRSAAIESKTEEVITRSILVAEDSITSRTLLVNILESAGYNVTAAVDGVDAFTKLSEGEFDIVVSDVEMPRMDGFTLTEKIRADKRYGEIPVVIVTSLASPEDKKRGIDAGANAYIVKSSFEQSNLMDVIKRLI